MAEEVEGAEEVRPEGSARAAVVDLVKCAFRCKELAEAVAQESEAVGVGGGAAWAARCRREGCHAGQCK